MTSKEALFDLIFEGRRYINDMKLMNLWKIINDDLEVLEIVKTHKLLNYVIKNEKCAKMYNLTEKEINKIKVWLSNE